MKYTRRNALKMGAAASASLILPSAISCQNQEDKKLGIALVGLGNYSTNQLGPALEHTKHCRLAGIVTGTPTKAESWKEKYNIPEANNF